MVLGIDNKRFYFIAIVLIIMWTWLMVFYYLKADEITKDPCSICSERHGENVVCTQSVNVPASRVYYPNGSIKNVRPKIDIDRTIKGIENISNLNLSGLLPS